MSRIQDDYIWLTKTPRWHRALRWAGFALLIPAIVAAITLTAGGNGESATTVSAPTPKAMRLTHPAKAAPEARAVSVAFSPGDSAANDARAALPTIAADASDSAPEQAGDKARARQATQAEATDNNRWIQVRIKRGDTLSLAFARHGLSYRDSLAIAHLKEYGSHFTRGLRTGDRMRVRAGKHGHVLALDLPLGPVRTLQVRRDEDGYTGEIAEADVEHRTAFAVATINSSFYVDALNAGLSDNLIMNLAHLFSWDIDFAHDIHPGDRLVVLYDEIYRQGKKIRNGKILAAEYVTARRTIKALRYTDADGRTAYYAPSGKAMKKAFIRAPLDQFRISSSFSLHRKHPILNRIRKHEGTDFAAPTGTPIKATGDGRIIFRGRNGGYGNMIAIRHNSRITTRYGHMSRFKRGLGVGSHVRQGQVIGYVGMTGLATGPHVHYEFRVNGAPKNPVTVALPKANPLPRKYHADFQRKTRPLLAQMQALDRPLVASADTTRPQG